MNKQSGFMMMVIALLLVVIAGFATAFVAMIMTDTNASISTISANYAYDLPQAGIENESYQLSLGNFVSTMSSTIPITGQGEYQYKCNQYTAATTIPTGGVSISAPTIPLSSVANFAPFGSVTIDSEMIYYDGISGNRLW